MPGEQQRLPRAKQTTQTRVTRCVQLCLGASCLPAVLAELCVELRGTACPRAGQTRSTVEAGEEDNGTEQCVAGETEAPSSPPGLTQAGAVTAEQSRELCGPDSHSPCWCKLAMKIRSAWK